ncbi:unnamed protein product [Cyprideis torosa]|uniref:Mediator of RNA polymerase II transcription subunit 25 n=1 Tax=Cyprideis torosa TaxID=163714 RepID=A0A7R8W689_9CRUS|nr:unnamed protein product [Cyprideis torosa]CAG0886248.1 unnamed protein product [Cyprideis torosa]
MQIFTMDSMNASSDVSDVVFVIEATSNTGAYITDIKTSYIVPTLEHFNGGPLPDLDCGSLLTSTLYNIVLFFGSDVIHQSTTNGAGPFTLPQQLLQVIDKIDFSGGIGENQSHITEGLAVALQMFQDLDSLRMPGLKTSRHVILICNSLPFGLPISDAAPYMGMTHEDILSAIKKRGIHLSLISPRKIRGLVRIFEETGGDLTANLQTHNFAKDVRHLVLLNGFTLQDRAPLPPVSGSSGTPAQGATQQPSTIPVTQQTSTIPTSTSSGSSITQPSSVPPPQAPSPSMGSRPQRPPSAPGQQMPQGQMPGNQPPPPQAMQQNSVQQQSHIQTIQQQQQQVSMAPSSTSMMDTSSMMSMSSVQLPNQPQQQMIYSQASMTSGPPSSMTMQAGPKQTMASMSQAQMMGSVPQGPNQGMVQQQMMTPQGQMMMQGPPGQQPQQRGQAPPGQMWMGQPQNQGPNMGPGQNQMQPQMGPGFVQQQKMYRPGMNQQQANTMGVSSGQMGPIPSTTSTLLDQLNQPPNTTPQMAAAQMQMNQMGVSKYGRLTENCAIEGMQLQPGTPGSGQTPPPGQNQQRIKVWKGALEWVDKRGGTVGEQKRTVNCEISCIVANGEVAIKAENWPPKLYMQLIPKAIVGSLGNRFFRDSRSVLLHPTRDEALEALRIQMETNKLAGCVHFSSQVCDIKVLMLLYNNEKKAYVGFIPNDQNGVVERIKDVIKQQRLQQQQQQALRAGGGQCQKFKIFRKRRTTVLVGGVAVDAVKPQDLINGRFDRFVLESLDWIVVVVLESLDWIVVVVLESLD